MILYDVVQYFVDQMSRNCVLCLQPSPVLHDTWPKLVQIMFWLQLKTQFTYRTWAELSLICSRRILKKPSRNSISSAFSECFVKTFKTTSVITLRTAFLKEAGWKQHFNYFYVIYLGATNYTSCARYWFKYATSGNIRFGIVTAKAVKNCEENLAP